MIKARLGGCVNGKIWGFAYSSAKPQQPLMVSLLINDVLEVPIIANRQRQDIVDLGLHPTGFCGFEYMTHGKFAENGIHQVRAFLQDGQEITNSPFNLEELESKRYFFIHIPKTAGTSFRRMLNNQFKSHTIYPNQTDLSRLYNNAYPSVEHIVNNRSRRNQVYLLTGHYPFNTDEDFFNMAAKKLVFLRDPIKRSISNIFHMKRYFNQYHECALDQIIMEGENWHPEIYNRQCLLLSGKSIEDNPKDILELAKSNLENCEFIGITEAFDTSIKLCNKQFGWNLGPVLHENINTVAKKGLSKSLLKNLEQANQLDIELYDFARKLFKDRKKRIL